jgi:hypothetical protein
MLILIDKLSREERAAAAKASRMARPTVRRVRRGGHLLARRDA